METRRRPHHGWNGTRQRISEDAIEPAHYYNNCGGHLMNHHPTIGLTDVFAAMLPSLRFTPGLHINYAETVLPHARWPAEAEGFPEGIRRVGRTTLRINTVPVSDRT